NAPFRKVPADKAPGVSVFPIFPPPGLLTGQAPSDQCSIIKCQILDSASDGAHRQKLLVQSGFKGALAYAQFQPMAFLQVVAKIAHGYAVFNVGLEGFKPLLLPIILGESQSGSFLVGNAHPPMPTLPTPPDGRRYQIAAFQCESGGEKYLGALIRLFATERPLTPVYAAIFGQPLA